MAAGLALVLSAACRDEPTPTAPDATTETTFQVQPGEKARVLVLLSSPSARGAVAEDVRRSGGRVLREYGSLPILALEVGTPALEGLQRSPRVTSIVEDRPHFPTLESSLPVINADAVHDLGWDGSSLAIAILDTGIDDDHPFLAGRVVEQACFSTHDPDNDRTSLCAGNLDEVIGSGAASIDVPACDDGGETLCDHGTHVAGIAVGDGSGLPASSGVAPGADLIAIQVFHRRDGNIGCFPNKPPCVVTFTSDYLAALVHVLSLSGTHTIAAANMSFGGGSEFIDCDEEEQPTKFVVDLLASGGIATVISAGNDGHSQQVGSPACISSAVTVGATDNSDAVAEFSNRGTLLDLFAPGVEIFSSAEAGSFELKNGTSMAAPHVAGAWAVMRQLFVTSSVGDILNRLQTTGIPIAYESGGEYVSTPRIDLLAAMQTGAPGPDLTVNNQIVTVVEGQGVSNAGTFGSNLPGDVTLSASIGDVTVVAPGTWVWTFHATDGPDESQNVTVTATDPAAQQTKVHFALVVENSEPKVVIDAAQETAVAEGGSLVVTAHFSDGGVEDSHTAAVTCFDVDEPVTVPGTIQITSTSGPKEGTVTATCPYGDDSNPTFETSVSVVDDDGGEGTAAFEVTVANIVPSASINPSSATVINGLPTFIGQLGEPMGFDGDVTDPGSDDLVLEWNWGDGFMDQATYLVDGPDPDPLPSPDVNPRSITDSPTHTWTDACMFTVTLTATDDDGGIDSDEGTVVMAGASGTARGQGHWASQYRGRSAHFDPITLGCYLEVAGHMSAVFNEVRDASTGSKAAQVLHVKGNEGDLSQLLDQELLAAWLNFANGAFAYDELVDTTGDQVGDTPFSSAVTGAEAVRLDPTASAVDLEAQKNLLEAINLMHGG